MFKILNVVLQVFKVETNLNILAYYTSKEQLNRCGPQCSLYIPDVKVKSNL